MWKKILKTLGIINAMTIIVCGMLYFIGIIQGVELVPVLLLILILITTLLKM